MSILLASAIFPIVVLCYYIYVKDINKEPSSLLAKIFILGFYSAIPVVIVEIALGIFFQSESGSFLSIFISTFISVALVEEGFKWFITKLVGYNNKEFDEIYDIIVYAVFASLGFACVENILYVFGGGINTAIYRAFTTIPVHTCNGVIMGYYMGIAKRKNGDKGYLFLSLFMPVLAHTIYDFLLLARDKTLFFWWFVLYIVFVIICVKIVNKVSKMEERVDGKIIDRSIYNPFFKNNEVNYCANCGSSCKTNYCAKCGYKVKKDN